MGRHSPTVRHRRLTRLLGELREAAGMTREEAAAHMEWYGSKVSRFETGDWKRIQPHDLRGLLEVYGVTDRDAQDAYVQLAREAGQKGWWAPYSDIVGAYVGFEAEASSVRTFEPQYVPGLLQTEEYARALIEANPTITPNGVERRVHVRMERQKILGAEKPPNLWAVIDEQAIHRPVGDAVVMLAQLKRLRDTIREQHVTVQVLPIEVGAHPGMDGAFVILDYPTETDKPLVYVETATDGLYLEETETVESYSIMFNHLIASALSPAETVRLLERAASRYE